MDSDRLLELALETLKKQRAEIETSIAEIREMQDGNRQVFSMKPALIVAKRRSKTLAERRAHSLRMKKYWSAKKAQAIRSAAKAKAPAGAAKARTKTAAEKKALSLKMREVWKKRKAAANSKAANPQSKTSKAPQKA